MKPILQLLITILIVSIPKQLQAQIENNTGFNNSIGKIESIISTNANEVKKPKSIKIDANDGFKKAYENEQKKLQKKQKEESLQNKGILTKAKLREERFSRTLKKINGMYLYPVIDQDLGSFRTNANSVNIICRDFQYPDGDRVTILINEIPVVVNIVLKQHFQTFNIPLDKGINTITILALNQGSSGPNTAAFKIYNNTGSLISSNEWNLATGAKASLIIAREK